MVNGGTELFKSIREIPPSVLKRAQHNPQHKKELVHCAFQGHFPRGKVADFSTAVQRMNQKFEAYYGLALLYAMVRAGEVLPEQDCRCRISGSGFRRYVQNTRAATTA